MKRPRIALWIRGHLAEFAYPQWWFGIQPCPEWLWQWVVRRVDRWHKERCPNCEGKYDEVYQYVEEYREEAGIYDHDDRWFCFCGHTEVPDKDSTLADWRGA